MAKHIRMKVKAKTEPAMRITAGRRKTIEQLAEKLAAIAPSTSPGAGFCVQRVSEGMSLKDCWRKQKNKKADIAYLLQNTLRGYPQKPKKLVLSIIEGGVKGTARRGERVSAEHLDSIAELMETLGFNIRKELANIKIPEPSRVREPAQDLAALFDRLDLHESLKDDVAQMFRDGHLNEAVRKALERFEKRIQDAINDHKAFGRDLMAKAFNENNPLIQLNEMKTATDRSEQEGFKFLTMGAMSGMRNLYSHGDVEQMTAMDALERLAFVSLLFKRVEKTLIMKGE